jgi:SP family arabinose:H+ symporter-like MFS transporter
MSSSKINMRYIFMCTLVAALGGLLFGYDTAVINGAIKYVQIHFGLSAALKGWAAASALVGCIFGAMFAGLVGDRFGRRKSLMLCAVLFSISAIFSAVPQTLTQFVWARFIGGLGVGGASMLAPLYIAEIAPEKIRGRLVSLYQLAIVTGILVVFFVNMLIQGSGDEVWNTTRGWRWMFASETLPAVVFGLALMLVPESPRWLMKAGRKQEAEDILTRTVGREQAEQEIVMIASSMEKEEGRISELFHKGFRTPLIIGIMLAVFQQLSGINAVMYYSTEIIESTGVSSNSAFMQTVAMGVINLLATFVAIGIVDRVGRKVLLLGGIGVQVVSLAAIGVMFNTGGSPYVLLAFILIYVAAFSAAMGPVTWIVLSEIFPNKIRGRAMSIATLFLWTVCYLVSQTFPVLVEFLGIAATFFFFSASCFICLVFIARFVPETKGKSLEEIEQLWNK